MGYDIIIDFKYNSDRKEPFDLQTNARPSAISEILSEYLRNHLGAEKDESPIDPKKIYHIMVGLDLRDDSFGHYSDTGNQTLTDVIISDSISKLEELAAQRKP